MNSVAFGDLLPFLDVALGHEDDLKCNEIKLSSMFITHSLIDYLGDIIKVVTSWWLLCSLLGTFVPTSNLKARPFGKTGDKILKKMQ